MSSVALVKEPLLAVVSASENLSSLWLGLCSWIFDHTSQSIFQVEVHGYSTSDLQAFSAQVMKVFNSIPQDQWPNQRMLGEFLFHKLRTVRRLERAIDEIKRSSDDSPLRDFDFLWSRLQEFLVEEREDANARSIEQSLKSPKQSANIPKAKTPAVPAKAAPAAPTNANAAAAPSKAVPKKADVKSPPKGKSKGHGKPLSAEEKAKTPCTSTRCRQIVFMVQSVPTVIRKLHLQSPRVRAMQIQSRSLRLHQQQQPRPWRLLPSLLRQCLSHPKLGWLSGLRAQVLEDIWLPLASSDQGYDRSFFDGFSNQSHESLRFSTGGGQKDSSFSIGFQDRKAFLGKPIALSWTHAPWFGRLDLM